MKAGIFLIAPRPDGHSIQRVLEQAIQDATLAETLGFDRVWLAEHHGTDFGICWSPSVLAAAIAAHTSRIDIGYAINVAPFHQPRRLAEDIALVDHLSGGRVVAGFGSGYSPLEYQVLAADYESRSHTSRITLEQVLGHWRDGSDTGVACHQDPHPPIVIACRTEGAIRSVAEAGHGVLLLGDVDRISAGAAAYREVTGSAGYVGALRHVHVGNLTDEGLYRATAWTVSRIRALAGQEAAASDDDVGSYLRERVSIGVEALRRDVDQLSESGVDELICWMRWGDLASDAVRSSMETCSDLLSN